MEFSVNSPVLFLLAGIIVAVVLAQSVYFLVKAWRRGREIGMPMDKLKKVVIGTAIFTVAPATAIVISVISLSKKLGIPLPWMRLSVVGAITYETPAAANALSAMGLEWAKISSLTAQQYVTIAAVMTGTFVIESIFNIPGMGKYFVMSIKNSDYTMISGTTIFYGALLIACTLIVDLLYGFIDPRVKLEE